MDRYGLCYKTGCDTHCEEFKTSLLRDVETRRVAWAHISRRYFLRSAADRGKDVNPERQRASVFVLPVWEKEKKKEDRTDGRGAFMRERYVV